MALKDQESLFKPFKPEKYQPADTSQGISSRNGITSGKVASTLAPATTPSYNNPETGDTSKAKKAEPVVVQPSEPPFKYDSDYQALLTYATNQGYTLPSDDQKKLQNSLVLALKDNDIWGALDLFYVFATDGDVNFASLNWRFPNSYKVTPVNDPTFTANVGFTGNGTDAYLDTGWNTTLGSKYERKYASHGVFTNSHRGTNITGDIGYHGGGSGPYAAINYYNADFGINGRDGFYINTNSAVNLTPLTTNFRAVTINGQTQQSYRYAAYSVGSNATTQPLNNDRIYIMQRGIAGSEWYAPSSIEFKADFWGGFLDASQIKALGASLDSYVNAL